jgi:hypothetical protein
MADEPSDVADITPALLEQLGRVLEHVDDSELAALLKRLADRYQIAKERRETGEATIRVKFHRGAHDQFRWNADERVVGGP